MQLKYRIVGGFGALLLAGTAVVTSTALSGASATGPVSDAITFAGKAYIAVPPTATKPGTAVLVAKQCSLVSDGEKDPFSCTLTGTATLTRTGGTLTGTISSRDGIISFHETFVNTSPTTGVGTGTVREFDFDDKCTSTGTFTASFTTSATGVPNILNDHGRIVVTDNAAQSCDSENVTTTTVLPTTTVGGA